MTLDPRLETFLTVAEAGGFGRAARRLGLSQPAVSYRIRQLELSIGAPVIQRGTGRFQLTPTGGRLAVLGRGFADELRQLSQDVAPGAAQPSEPLRIATVSGFGRYVLFPRLLQPDYPRFELYYRPVEEVLALLRDGTVDLGYVYARQHSRALTFRPVYTERLELIVPRTGRGWNRVNWLKGGAETVPFVTYEEHDYVFGKWFADITRRKPRRFEVVAHFDRLEETIDAVAAGWGASIVPGDAAVGFGGTRVRRVSPGGRRSENQVFQVEPTRPRPEWARDLGERLARVLGTAAVP